MPFATRILTGALSGAAIGAASGIARRRPDRRRHRRRDRHAWWTGVRVRGWPAAFGNDRPAALIEDAVAIGGAFLIMMALP